MSKRTNVAAWQEKYKRWQINVQKDGRRRSFYSSMPGRVGQRDCHAKADMWLDDGIECTSTKAADIFKEYIEDVKATTSKSNWLKVQSIWDNWIEPGIGRLKITNVTEHHLQSIINKAFAKGLAKKSLQNIRANIMAFIKYCRMRKVCTLFPEGLAIPKGAQEKGKSILQPDELAVLFDSDQTTYRAKPVMDKYINAYRFQVATGLRPGELMGLKWSDIDGNTVHIQRSINYLREVTHGKNKNAVRKFVMSALARDILDKQCATFGCEYIFGDMNLQTYEKWWRRYREHNKITVTLYELRHTFVSIIKRLPEGEVKTIVGHSKNMDTFGTYGHELHGEMKRTAQNIQSIFKDILSRKKKSVL